MSMMLAAQVFHLDIDKTSAFVLMAICDVAEDDGTGCIGSDDYIMWKTGVSRATFYRTLARLEKLSIVKRVPLADGRTETLVALARAPRKTPWREVRAQLLAAKSQRETETSQNETVKVSSLKMRLQQSQNETERVCIDAPASQADSRAAAPSPTGVIHPSYPSSLLREPQAASREGATAKQSKADPERSALTAALAKYPQYFGQPRTASECALWNKRLTSLLAGGLTPGDVPRAVNAWKRKYPHAQLTINALDLHLGELLPAPSSVPIAPTSIPTAGNEATPQTPQYATPQTPDAGPMPEELTPDEQRLYARIFGPTTCTRPPDGSATDQRDSDERRRAASERARAALAASQRRAEAEMATPRRRLFAAGGPPLQVS